MSTINGLDPSLAAFLGVSTPTAVPSATGTSDSGPSSVPSGISPETFGQLLATAIEQDQLAAITSVMGDGGDSGSGTSGPSSTLASTSGLFSGDPFASSSSPGPGYGGAVTRLLQSVLGSGGSGITGLNAPTPTPAASALPAGVGVAAAADALRYLGLPYKYGGDGPQDGGLDCSGLVQRAFREVGVSLPRTAADQAAVGVPVAGLDEARPGDLLAFGSPADHIGIYLGDGRMVEAPHTGASVRISDLSDRRDLTDMHIVRITANPAVGASGAA